MSGRVVESVIATRKHNSPDVLDPTFRRIFDEECSQLSDEMQDLFGFGRLLPPSRWFRLRCWLGGLFHRISVRICFGRRDDFEG